MKKLNNKAAQAAAPAETGKKFRLPLSAYLSYLLVACLLVMGVTFSGYVSSAGGSDSARVAKFEVTQDGDMLTTTLSAAMAPGDSKSWTVEVVNDSETTIDHYIRIDNLSGTLPLYFVIEGQSDPAAYETYTKVSAEGKSGSVLISGSATFTLTAVWPNDASDYPALLGKALADDFAAFQALPGNGSKTMEQYLEVVTADYCSPAYGGKVDNIQITLTAQQAD